MAETLFWPSLLLGLLLGMIAGIVTAGLLYLALLFLGYRTSLREPEPIEDWDEDRYP